MRAVSTRKSFKADVAARREDPMVDILSSAQEARAEASPETPAPSEPTPVVRTARYFMPRNAEKKSRRVQLTMPPSLHAKVQAAAEALGLSFNEYACRVFEAGVEDVLGAAPSPRGGEE